jgi:hypothetical protein
MSKFLISLHYLIIQFQKLRSDKYITRPYFRNTGNCRLRNVTLQKPWPRVWWVKNAEETSSDVSMISAEPARGATLFVLPLAEEIRLRHTWRVETASQQRSEWSEWKSNGDPPSFLGNRGKYANSSLFSLFFFFDFYIRYGSYCSCQLISTSQFCCFNTRGKSLRFLGWRGW